MNSGKSPPPMPEEFAQDRQALRGKSEAVVRKANIRRAAIQLRVPVSGDPEIDRMIRAANRRDIALAICSGQPDKMAATSEADLERLFQLFDIIEKRTMLDL